MRPVLGYWKARILGQPIRLLLAYKRVDFEDKQYEIGGPPDYDKTCWFSVKYNLGLDFPHLPYYIDEDVKLTQSIAILRYLGRKYDLEATTEEEMRRIDILVNEAMDFEIQLWDICYFNYDQKPEFLRKLPEKMKRYSDFLGHRSWFAGEKLTFADFLIYEFVDQHRVLDPTCLDGAPPLQRFMARFEALEPIREYMASPSFMMEPLFNKYSAYEIEQREKAAAAQGGKK